MIRTGALPVESLITHRYDLVDAAQGYDALFERPDEALGVIFRP